MTSGPTTFTAPESGHFWTSETLTKEHPDRANGETGVPAAKDSPVPNEPNRRADR